VQHAGSARHSTTGDVYCMRAVPVTPRWRVNSYKCTSISTENRQSDYSLFSTCSIFPWMQVEHKLFIIKNMFTSVLTICYSDVLISSLITLIICYMYPLPKIKHLNFLGPKPDVK